MVHRIRKPFIIACSLCAFFSFLYGNEIFSTKNAIYYNKQGWDSLEKDDPRKAILYFKQALRQNPNYRESLIGMGKAYLKTEAYEEASKFFEKAFRIDSTNPDITTGLGIAMTGLGRYSEAIEWFEKSLQRNANDIDAHYGIAQLYFGMGNDLWTKRKLETIFKINPYHYDSLVLLSNVKIRERRFSDAMHALERAISAFPQRPDAYVALGKLHLAKYRATNDDDELGDAIREFQNALSKQTDNAFAHRYLGIVSLLKKDYENAVTHFTTAKNALAENAPTHYNCALAYDRLGVIHIAHENFSKAIKRFPYDSFLSAGFEDFLIAREFKMGNPSRVRQSDIHYEKAIKAQKYNLFDLALLHCRRAVLLNPMKLEARKFIKDYYYTQDYYSMYLDELKDMERIFPEEGFQETLNIAILKRRDKLYYKIGFGHETIPRDIPSVLVLDFMPQNVVPLYFDAGRIIANQITFALSQFGRLKPIEVKDRENMLGTITFDDEYVEKNINKIHTLTQEGKLPKVDFIIFGRFLEGADQISSNFSLMNFHTGVIIGDFAIAENGHDALQKFAIKAARKIYEFIPYSGRVLKHSEDSTIVNLGLFDGIEKDNLLVIFKKQPYGERGALLHTKKILLKVTEPDTFVSSVSPINNNDSELIEIGDVVYPLQKRRAKRLE
ncbi:MAG: tetratricopeptide repeat protein [Spirochaetes bacterium]|nr:tetratricopeptide repeat protein [Spirochaetota bacterium]